MSGARVTIAYSELKSLLQAAEAAKSKLGTEKKAPPPMKGVVRSATYTLTVTDGSSTLEADYEIESLVDGWQAIPLLAGDARLERAVTDSASVVWHNDYYCLLVESKGVYTAELTLAAPAPEQWNTEKGMQFAPGDATLSRLEIVGLSDQQDIEIGSLPSTRSAEGTLVFHLPAKRSENFLRITQAILETDSKPDKSAEIIPSIWNIQSEILADYADGRLSYRGSVYCQTDAGSGVSIDLAFPKKATNLAIVGDDLHQWQFVKGEDGARNARAYWKSRDVLDRKLELSYEIPQSPLASEWIFQAPSVTGGSDTQTLLAIAAVDGLELIADGLKASVQSRRLPSWMHGQIEQRDFLTAETTSNIAAKATWLPRLKTAQAVIKNASYQTRLVTNGAMLTQAECTIEHRAPLNWVLEVPQGSDFIKCEVNSGVMKPIKRSETQIEFPLPAPPSDSAATTKVTFTYSNGSTPLDPVSGKIELALPRTDLFIHRLDWELSIPEQYSTTGIQGNLDIASGEDSAEKDAIHLRKELCRGEQPATEIYYEKRGLAGN